MSAGARLPVGVRPDRDERCAGYGCLTDGCRVAADLLERRLPRSLLVEGDRTATAKRHRATVYLCGVSLCSADRGCNQAANSPEPHYGRPGGKNGFQIEVSG